MTSPVTAAPGAPAPLWRRAFDRWLVQVKHVLPPAILFFSFNLILFTRWMTLWEHGIPFADFFAATLASPNACSSWSGSCAILRRGPVKSRRTHDAGQSAYRGCI